MRTIPQSNPRASYLAHRADIDAAVAGVLDKGQYILGENVEAFEQEFAAYIGVSHAIGVASGTDALMVAFRACGVGNGDEVITVSHTAVATVAAIELAGAVPVFVDIDEKTFTIDVSRIEPAITPATKAIVAVHLYGRMANMAAISALAKERNLLVIEDCAQGHGALSGAKRAGSLGDIAAFSFYPTKNLGAIGDGGMVVTNNAEYAGEARLLRQYGWRQRYISERSGINSRLDEIQAAVLRVKLPYLDKENNLRRTVARIYDKELVPSRCAPAPADGDGAHVYHQYVVQIEKRDTVREQLLQKGISTAIHYPVPVHLQPAYRERLRCAGPMAATERAVRRIISLPMFPELHVDDAVFVAGSVREMLESIKA